MDFSFTLVTLTFLFFLFLSYYLDVLKLSSPLVLIYLIFCFSSIINKDVKDEKPYLKAKTSDRGNSNASNGNLRSEKLVSKDFDSKDKQKLDISKPVVSFNPKPIIIDSNLIIQKEKIKSETKLPQKKLEDVNVKIEKEDRVENSLVLKEIMICRGVYKRNPIKPGFNFTNNVDSLFCYTKISNSGSKQEIKHLWYFKEKLITSVVYNIKTSYNYRSWSKKTILPSQIGQWRVDIVDIEDKILGSRKFEISSRNNAF